MSYLHVKAPSKDVQLVALLCFVVIAGRFALDSYLPSMPMIARDFGSMQSQVQLTLSLYHLGFGSSQFIYGPLSDFFGRRKILLVGLMIFVCSGVLCSLSNSVSFLIVSRFLAGVGAGAGSTLSRAIISDVFDETAIAKSWARITSSLIVSLMVAPLVGGYIQELVGWRYNFVISTLFSSVVLLLIFKYLPETLREKKKINLSGVVQTYAKLSSNASFIGYILCSTLSFSGLAIYFQLSPFIFIDGIKLTPSIFGWLSCIIAGCYILSGVLVNNFASRLGTYRMLKLGIGFLILGGGLMLGLSITGFFHLLSIFLPTVLFVIGARIVIPNATAGSLFYGKKNAGVAAALVGGTQMVGCSIISFLVAKSPLDSLLVLSIAFTSIGILSAMILHLLVAKAYSNESSRKSLVNEE